MAKSSNQRITGVKTSSLAMYEGVFAAILGLGIAVMYSLRNSVEIANSTDSVLAGLAFGMTAGIVSILVLPLIYFAFGWVIGMLHGFVFNVISETSGGIVVRVSEDKEK